MKLIWSRKARQDRREIFAYIGQFSYQSAIDIDELFAAKAKQLLDFPRIGRTGRVPGTREFVVHKNYFLVYGVKEHEIHILNVVHGARQWPPLEP